MRGCELQCDTAKTGYYEGDRLDMFRFIPNDVRKLLDVGCGSGNFGRLIKSQKDVEVWGLECIEAVAAEGATKLDRIVIGDFEKDFERLPHGYFNCIVFNDVLEHLRDPWAALKNASYLLGEPGYIVASVPNMRFFPVIKALVRDRSWEYADCGVMDRTHLRFFTIDSIRNAFISSGYSILKIEGINSYEFPWKLNLLNHLLMGRLDDMRYLQIACVAKKCINPQKYR